MAGGTGGGPVGLALAVTGWQPPPPHTPIFSQHRNRQPFTVVPLKMIMPFRCPCKSVPGWPNRAVGSSENPGRGEGSKWQGYNLPSPLYGSDRTNKSPKIWGGMVPRLRQLCLTMLVLNFTRPLFINSSFLSAPLESRRPSEVGVFKLKLHQLACVSTWRFLSSYKIEYLGTNNGAKSFVKSH